MQSHHPKKKLIVSSSAIVSILIHIIVLFTAGTWVAFNYVIKRNNNITVEPPPRLERRKLQVPVKQEPFIEQMTKPKIATTSRLAANRPQMVNIPEQGTYTRMAPSPTFKGAYTNFVQVDNTMQYLAKYRASDFGLSAVDFMGTRGKAEKVVMVVDASKSMMYDDIGGPNSYKKVKEDVSSVISSLRSATLFNLVLFDHDKVTKYRQDMIPATPVNKSSITNWFNAINTNFNEVGIPENMVNYTPEHEYDVPMRAEDRTGWLRGFQVAIEMQPEIIFILTAEWGNITTIEDRISYFMNREKHAEYQKIRAQLFLEDDDLQEEMDEYSEKIQTRKSIAERMLELENEARMAVETHRKIIKDWDEILIDNNEELPMPPIPKGLADLEMAPGETRYTSSEVLETFFSMMMDQYRDKGVPSLRFVLLIAEDFDKYPAESASMATSYEKFKNLANSVKGGRFRDLDGERKISNYTRLSYNRILKDLELEDE